MGLLLFTFWVFIIHSVFAWRGYFVFKDEFSGDSLRSSLWEHADNCDGKHIGSQSLECFQKGKNIEVANGTLFIRARVDIIDERKDTPYTSGKIRTHGNGFSYGTYVIRARMPKGKHLISSFWIQPINQDNDFCHYEEINVVEYRGSRPSTLIFSGAYGRDYRRSNVRKYEKVFQGTDFSQDFHEFALQWGPTSLKWFVDGKRIHEMTTHFRTDWTHPRKSMQPCAIRKNQALFSQESHLLISLGVGGIMFPHAKYGNLTRLEALSWPKPNLEIDYVHIYQD